MKRTWRPRVSVVILTVLFAVAGGIWYQESQPYHFLTVTPGKLYRSGTLEPRHLERVLDEHSIKTVVSLRWEGERAIGDWYERETTVCDQKNVNLINLPIHEPPDETQIAKWLELLSDEENFPMLVHCKHGAVRTALMVAVYEMEFLGKENQRAFDELESFGHDFNSPVRLPLRDFILDYVPVRGRPDDAPSDLKSLAPR